MVLRKPAPKLTDQSETSSSEYNTPSPTKETRQVNGFYRDDFISKNIVYLKQLYIDKKKELEQDRFAEQQQRRAFGNEETLQDKILDVLENLGD